MRAKKARTGRRSIRYWLFADPKLQKLSLKKVSERGTKPAGAARRIRGTKATVVPAGPPASGSATTVRRVLALAGFVLIVAAALALERQSARGEAPAGEARDQPPVMTRPQIVPPVSAKPHATGPASSLSSTTRPPEKPGSAKIVNASAPAAVAKPVPAMLVTTPNPDPAAASAAEPTPSPVEPAPKPADSTMTSAATGAALVTVTGCLQQDEDLFWIKNASGAEAPRTRSWKSGFLRKQPAPIEIVGPIGRLKLNGYVGRLVSATGTLEDRQMRPRSVREIAGSCQ